MDGHLIAASRACRLVLPGFIAMTLAVLMVGAVASGAPKGKGVTHPAADPLAGLPDPTRPPPPPRPPQAKAGPKGGEPPALVLESTFVTASHAVAVISGRTVNVGDRIGEAEVTEIHPYKVVLRDPKREILLRLMPMLEKTYGSDEK